MKKKIAKKIKMSLTLIMLGVCASTQLKAQYVHPNQAGRQGGNTSPGIGSQIVTSTYYGNVGNSAAQGVILSVNKDGSNATAFHDFSGYPSDGSYPFYTTPHLASDGNLYGTTYIGGANNTGAVYKYDFSNCSESVINNSYATDGGGNRANINELSDGNLYYIHPYAGSFGQGELRRMSKNGTSVTVIHTFKWSALNLVNYSTAAQAQVTTAGYTSAYYYDGAYPYGFVVEGADGKIYGSTYAGGLLNYGTCWRCNKDGSSYEVINIGDPTYRYNFYKDGSGSTIPASYNLLQSWGNVAQGQDGKIYMVGYTGGVNNYGGLARMNTDGSGYQILISGNAAIGTYPYRGPIIVDNQVFGTFRTNGGGTSIGTVWRYDIPTNAATTIKQFDNTNSYYADGTDPWAGLSYDGTYLYGTTLTNGGTGAVGTLYKIKPDGTGFQTLYRFKSTSQTGCGAKPGNFMYYPSAERVTFANVSLSCSKTCAENYICNAGTISPALSATSLSNTCPATTVNLNTVTASNTPSGAVLQWHTAIPAREANKVITTASVTAGTYYAVFFDSVNGCYSNSNNTTGYTTATVTINTCNPCSSYSAPTLITTSKSNTCPTTTVDLTSIVTSTAPSGTSITWHSSSPATALNLVSNPSTVSSGTYYATYNNTSSNCYGITSLPLNITISNCVPPDLVPTHQIDDLNFIAAGVSRDLILNIREVNNASGLTGNPLQVRVSKISGWTITYLSTSGVSNVFGGIANDNGDFTFTEDANFITATLKLGVNILANGSKKIGFNLSRKTNVPVNTSQNITSTIIAGSVGETKADNNIVVTTITAN